MPRPSDAPERPRAARRAEPPATPPFKVEGKPKTPAKKGGADKRPTQNPRFMAGFLLIAVVYLIWVLNSNLGSERSVRIPYSPNFLSQVDSGNVERISVEGTQVSGELKTAIRYPNSKAAAVKNFDTEIPVFSVQTNDLAKRLQDHDVVISASPINQSNIFVQLVAAFGPILLILGLMVWFMRRSRGGSPLGAFGRSKARRAEASEQRVTFKDVAGIDESKAELTEVVDFLKHPERYQALGGKIPRGVLLSGQPGTGKTLLARAVAGEADVPFFSISASEFVEAIVGVGASRVRDLFAEAKKAAPTIIFIDELDAIGRSRSSGLSSGANDEREQTLNQILTEMDGFDSQATVIVLAATNRPEILDSALLRPGRFDRRVAVPAPDRDGRRMILDVHTRSVPLADDVDLDGLAATTPGMVGADIANLCNEAALLAARRMHEKVSQADFTDALEKTILGAPRGILLGPRERRRIAVHEAGHAIVGMMTEGADPVRKVSIIPRGMALGVTISAPDEDAFNFERETLLGKIDVSLGGRVAEELVFGTITTGAESDIEQLTRIARGMVGRWGMSSAIGPVAVIPSESRGMLMPGTAEVSEATQRLVDEEVRMLAEESHHRVTTLLSRHRDKLDGLVDALLEHETVDQVAAYEAAGVELPIREVRDRPEAQLPPPAQPPAV